MNTASLELCKELYELSGWNNPKPGVYEIEKAWRPTPMSSGKNHRLINIGPNMPGDMPAYDLGYLLRKIQAVLPRITGTEYEGKLKNIVYLDTPEDTAAALAIELFKQGVL